MNKKILIAYGSRFGSTEEITDKISSILTEKGIKTEIINLRKVKNKNWPSLDGFTGLIVGSGVRMGRWTKEPKKFLARNKEQLNRGELTIGLFVSCGDAAAPENVPKAREDYVETVMDELEFKADIYDAFAGVFDLTETSKIGYLDKKALVMVAKRRSEGNSDLEANKSYDFRDWDQIKSYAGKYAELVLQKT
ncbi:MAG: flavodoxin domain-containing protein [Candidatus Hodarchaeales archaeon]|jgi:menaquinone-dependent protoporphyrinogen oxidase